MGAVLSRSLGPTLKHSAVVTVAAAGPEGQCQRYVLVADLVSPNPSPFQYLKCLKGDRNV